MHAPTQVLRYAHGNEIGRFRDVCGSIACRTLSLWCGGKPVFGVSEPEGA